VDQLDSEGILRHWDEAGSAAEKDAVRAGVAEFEIELRAELAASLGWLEGQVPLIAERVCARTASVRDFQALPWALSCARAVANWKAHFPGFGDGLADLKKRLDDVLAALTALDPAGPWTPPMAADEHSG